ncbi:hypothetical protein [Pseudotabrizicola algicola]|uniref:Glycosyl transferase n=1 Tax=Pseudotabrizicola algicola TaxID=2709381 RepID=A0A6B3RI94_9RHOB|nr:hypothetical protein [Pseudotabrizicola algicola]NEX45774.1 hypothetical protein [Pseudotabrizicola algicola]
MTEAPDSPVWQLVLVLWGTKYPVAEVNHLIATVCRHAARPPRVVLITDRLREGMAAGVVQRLIPDFFMAPEMRGAGCQTKLCMFEAGVVPDDLPAIFIDIDTVVLGDLTRLLALQRDRRTVAILQSAVLPFGALARALFRLTKGRKYARGNSSIVVYHPAETAHIAARYRALVAEHGFNGIRPMIADERFISWAHQPHMRAIPRHLAVKLPTEFMLPWRWLIHLRARMPWVRRRWAGLVALTLPGAEVKGEALLALPEGGEVVDRKGRRLIWSEAALGPVKARLTEHYRALENSGGTA